MRTFIIVIWADLANDNRTARQPKWGGCFYSVWGDAAAPPRRIKGTAVGPLAGRWPFGARQTSTAVALTAGRERPIPTSSYSVWKPSRLSGWNRKYNENHTEFKYFSAGRTDYIISRHMVVGSLTPPMEWYVSWSYTITQIWSKTIGKGSLFVGHEKCGSMDSWGHRSHESSKKQKQKNEVTSWFI